jgi:gluconolactonase
MEGTPNRSIWSYDVNADGTVGAKTKLYDADQGALDGFRVDREGNLWIGYGSNGALQSEPVADASGRKVFLLKGKSEDFDGVLVLNTTGKAISFIN